MDSRFPVVAVCVSVLAAFPGAASAQLLNDSRPRAAMDSVYAVKLELDALANAIRQGTFDARMQRRDTQLSGIVAALKRAGKTRRRGAPRPELGPAWDFQFDSITVVPEGAALRVYARALLATDPAGAAPVSLFFRRTNDRWLLVSHTGLVAQLRRLAQRLQGGQAQ